MSSPLVECVPNFSEGRNSGVIEGIAAQIHGDGVWLLDVNSDADHHRTVVTFAGTPDAVEEAMLRAARVAVEMIDIDQHQGVHPRLGAVDVVPFIPLRGISLAECAARARLFGRKLAETLHIPVYLYEAAALRPDRVNLADVRRGGYELLREAIGTDPNRIPDFGPAAVGKAGATIVGARAPLIAFNAYLDTADVAVAQAIAQSIRASGGGVPYLKAMGVLVKGRAQVSMNVIDFRQTSLYTIMRALEAEAHRLGVKVLETELVGLAPQSALIAAGLEALRLPAHMATLVLERRLGATVGDYREVTFE